MKTRIINLSEFERYFELMKMETSLGVTMKHFHDTQKLQLKRLKHIRDLTYKLKEFKYTNPEWYSQADDTIKYLLKGGKFVNVEKKLNRFLNGNKLEIPMELSCKR